VDSTTIFLIIFFPSFLLFILGIIYINKKYPDKATKLDPLTKGIIISACLFSLLAVAGGVGIIEKELVQKSIPYFVLGGILLVIYFSIIQYYKNKPIPFHKRHQIALNDIKTYYNATPYIGKAHDISLRYHSVYEASTPLKGDIKEMITGVVDAMLISVKREVFIMVLIIINVYSGENVKMVLNPSYNQVEKLVEKEAVSVYKEWEKDQKGEREEGDSE